MVTRAMRARGAAVLLLALGLPVPVAFAAPSDDVPQAEQPTWDRVESIKGAAQRLGVLHRTRGAKAAYEFIDACYKTQSLAEHYGEGFESCIAQDYLETKVLAQVYSRLPPEVFEKSGMPTPAALADAMGRRLVAAFNTYKMPVSFAEDLKKLVDEHGLPVFLAIVFPEAGKVPEDNPADKSKKK